jgi:hypothetical protein
VVAIGMGLMGLTSGSQPLTTKKIAVLMFKPRNYGTEWVDRTAVRSAVWTDSASASKFYQEESFGKWTLEGAIERDGDVFGWYSIPFDDDGTCVSPQWRSWARMEAAKEGFDEARYDAVIFVSAATGCAGRAWTSGRNVTVISGFTAPTIMHELGHAFGLPHARAWVCEDASGAKVSISSTCTASEYGDYAVMGATTSFHMNGFQKGALGFLKATNTTDVTASGVYALHSIERGTREAQVLRIPRTSDRDGNIRDYYYLELRQPYGFDAFAPTSPYVNGISIRVAPEYTDRGSPSYLLDTTTPAATGFGDAPLKLGATFTDADRRVNITAMSISGGVAQVRVDFF